MRNRVVFLILFFALMIATSIRISAPSMTLAADKPGISIANAKLHLKAAKDIHDFNKVKGFSAPPELAGGPEKKNRIDDTSSIINLSKQFPNMVYYSGSGSQKQVALTFDDGPDLHFTPLILNILKQYGVKATFFLIGQRAKAFPGIVCRIAAEGHVIGNHTWSHPDILRLNRDQIKAEILRNDQLLASILGYHPALFRPPYGAANSFDIDIIGSMGYKVIDWSVDTRDWAGTPPPRIMDLVRKELRPGGIILQHSAGNLGNTVKVLPQIIITLRAQGYSFVTIPELLNIPASKAV